MRILSVTGIVHDVHCHMHIPKVNTTPCCPVSICTHIHFDGGHVIKDCVSDSALVPVALHPISTHLHSKPWGEYYAGQIVGKCVHYKDWLLRVVLVCGFLTIDYQAKAAYQAFACLSALVGYAQANIRDNTFNRVRDASAEAEIR